MATPFRKTGLGVLGEMAWGSHCPGRRMAAAGVRASALLRDGSPSPQEIVRVARAKRSVAERVVRTATCPVLTVRGT